MTYVNNDFSDIISNRRSIREFDPEVKISNEEMKQIINDTVKAPSSVNMQPWRFVVIESAEGKEKLRPLIRFNQLQNDTSAAMIVILGDLEHFENAHRIFDEAITRGLMHQERKDEQMAKLEPLYKVIPQSEKKRIAMIDGSLAAMQLMLTARAYGYDTNPIGGFEREEVLDTFGFDKDRYEAIMVVSIGKAVGKGHESYRLPAEEITFWK